MIAHHSKYRLVTSLSVCQGCGCTDLSACIDAQTGMPCHWVSVDRQKGVGVCSACLHASYLNQ